MGRYIGKIQTIKYLSFVRLAQRKWWRGDDLARELQCSIRTIYRYAAFAKRTGLPLRMHSGCGGGMQMSPLDSGAESSMEGYYRRYSGSSVP